MSDDKIYSDKNGIKYATLSKKEVLENLDVIISSNTPLFRQKADKSMHTVPADKLKQFLGDDASIDLTFYLLENWREHIPIKSDNDFFAGIDFSSSEDISKSSESVDSKPAENDKTYAEKLSETSNLSIPERQKLVENNLIKLQKLNSDFSRFDITTITDTVKIFTETL